MLQTNINSEHVKRTWRLLLSATSHLLPNKRITTLGSAPSCNKYSL